MDVSGSVSVVSLVGPMAGMAEEKAMRIVGAIL